MLWTTVTTIFPDNERDGQNVSRQINLYNGRIDESGQSAR